MPFGEELTKRILEDQSGNAKLIDTINRLPAITLLVILLKDWIILIDERSGQILHITEFGDNTKVIYNIALEEQGKYTSEDLERIKAQILEKLTSHPKTKNGGV